MANPAPETSKNKPAQNAPAPAATNGNKPAPVPAAEPEAPKPVEAKEGDEKGEEKARGVIPQMPTCVVYREKSGTVVTALIHPRDQRVFTVRGKGVNGTMGTMGDEGYPLSNLKVDGPKWVIGRIPPDVTVLGYATVLGFPLPAEAV